MRTSPAEIKHSANRPLPVRGGVIAAALCLFLSAAPASAGGPGSAGLQVLKSDISPRAMGMGGAFAAIADDLYSMNYNPAGLGQLYMPEASALYLSGFEDAKLSNLAFAMPLPVKGFSGIAKPGMGVALMMSDAGSFRSRLINPNGTISERSYDAQKDIVLTVGYGEKVYSEDVKFEGYGFKLDQYVGVNMKYLDSTLLEDYSASAFAVDMGWLAMDPKLGLAVAASFSNFGTGLKYDKELTKLPSILRLGVSYQRPTVMDQSLLLAAEGDFYTAESPQKSFRVGLEYHFEKIFNLRLGYKAEQDNPGLTMGLGLRYEDLSLDFATGSGSEVYNTSQISLSYKFSGIIIKERPKKAFKDPTPQKKDQLNPAPAPQKKTGSPRDKKKESDFIWLY
ncbi:MAG: PorV/PorQ family protein [Elusimicrobia bacterium]|nr:PorV/PorQ family protein [Elusimicrobiota bacterium]